VKREKKLGFSLVELVVVMGIAAIIFAIAIPQFNQYLQNSYLKDAARSLEGDIQKVKQKAVAESTNYTISFDVVNSSYTIPTIYMANNSNTTPTITRNLIDFGRIILANTGNINNDTITLLSRGTADTTVYHDTITLRNGVLSEANIQTTSMGKVNVSYTFK
jgi:prepilin-type N-terminal cleavage/methylation domain-containing protein